MAGNTMWRKSSYSGGSGGDCVEVRDGTGRVLVRDTKDRTGPVVPFTPEAWRRFAARVKRSLAGSKARHLRAPLRPEGARSAVLTKPTLLPWPKIGPVIATISGRRRDATVRAMHAPCRLCSQGLPDASVIRGTHISHSSVQPPQLEGCDWPRRSRSCWVLEATVLQASVTPIMTCRYISGG